MLFYNTVCFGMSVSVKNRGTSVDQPVEVKVVKGDVHQGSAQSPGDVPSEPSQEKDASGNNKTSKAPKNAPPPERSLQVFYNF